MRLIDADALIAQMEADAEHMDEPIAKMFTYAEINDVKHAPTIEPERKPGRWEKCQYFQTRWYECSECGHFALRDECGCAVLSDYCPNCGAKMEG